MFKDLGRSTKVNVILTKFNKSKQGKPLKKNLSPFSDLWARNNSFAFGQHRECLFVALMITKIQSWPLRLDLRGSQFHCVSEPPSKILNDTYHSDRAPLSQVLRQLLGVQPLWSTVCQFLINIHLPYDPENSLRGVHWTEVSAHVHQKTCTGKFKAATFIVTTETGNKRSVHVS